MGDHRHKRDTDARASRRRIAAAGTLSLAVTATAVIGGVALAGQDAPDRPATTSTRTVAADLGDATATPAPRRPLLSRDFVRDLQPPTKLERLMSAKATTAAVRGADEKRWTTAPLNLWQDPTTEKASERHGVLPDGKHVLVTGRAFSGRQEIVVDGRSRWVTAGYLAAQKPKPEPAASGASGASAGLSTAPCPDSSVENGLTSGAVLVYRSVCHAFPQITSYGGWDAHGEHVTGKALDIMTTDQALGDQIAAFLQAHAAELNLYDVIWWDRIWTPVRASEGWRDYGDHGSATANHMDHVHVAVN